MTDLTRAVVADAVARLEPAALEAARWFGGKGRAIRDVRLGEAFDLSGDGRHVLAIVRVGYERGQADTYAVPFTQRGGELQPGQDGGGTLGALAVAIAEGRTIPALAGDAAVPNATGSAGDAAPVPGPVSAALVCRPARALRTLAPGGAATIARLDERPLGLDQSNTSVVLGERLLLKAYRRLQPGLNPELELVAYLSEEAAFSALPLLAGYAEVVTRGEGPSTVAMLQEFIADGADAHGSLADAISGWLLAPGEVSVEFATEIAEDVGVLTAGLHAALAGATGVPGFEPRPASRDELRAWHADARAQLDRALEISTGEAGRVLRELAPAIAAEFTVFEALASEPIVTRVHGDFHLGHLLVAADGFRIVDFEGEPTGGLEERRAHRSPLRDVASMLRSFDRVGRSAGHRAEVQNGGPLDRPGLDLQAWLARARERFLDAYTGALRGTKSGIEVDPALLRAFEIERECAEFARAERSLPPSLSAPTAGILGLLGDPPHRPA